MERDTGRPLRRPAPRCIEVVDEDMATVLRAKTGVERLAIANGLYRSAWSMLASYLASQHPDWDAQRLEREVARRIALGSG